MGGALHYRVDRHWPSPESAVAAARHIVRSCATDPHCMVLWDTSRLDAVATVRPFLTNAGGDAKFIAEDPVQLTALLREAGLDPSLKAAGDSTEIWVSEYPQILDALDHATLATRAILSIEVGFRENAEDLPGPDDTAVDRLVAAAEEDTIGLLWGCRWFGVTSGAFDSVSVDLNGDGSKIDGHRPGSHEVTVAINYKRVDAEQIAARIASTSGQQLVYQGLW